MKVMKKMEEVKNEEFDRECYIDMIAKQEKEIAELRKQVKQVQHQLSESIKAIGFYQRIFKTIREEASRKYEGTERGEE